MVVFVQQQQQEMGSFWYLTTNCFLGLEVETVYYKMTYGGFHSKISHVYAIFKEPIHNLLTTYIRGLSCQWKMRILCFSVGHNSKYGLVFPKCLQKLLI